MVRAFGANTTPSPVQFRYRMRLLILGSQPRKSTGTNWEMSEIISELAQTRVKNKKIKDKEPISSKQDKSSYNLLTTDDFIPEEESTKYLAGYLAWVLKRKGKGTSKFGHLKNQCIKTQENLGFKSYLRVVY